LQTTLSLLVEKMAPEIKDRIPVALRVARDGETPDVTSAVLVADPIATGYTMTQADLAAALGLSQPDVSVFVRAFKLNEEGVAVTASRPSTFIRARSSAFARSCCHRPLYLTVTNRRF
jgi:hypothetical protein